MTSRETCRFAPSTTGASHPGTLLAALLCWLDARRRGAHLLLRLEDLDPERCRPEWARGIADDLTWFGLEWDEVTLQSDAAARHADALDRLAEHGVLYPCECTRAQIRAHGSPSPDGGIRYPGTCRGRRLPAGGWRRCAEPLRAVLPAGRIEIFDESGLDLSQDPGVEMGDPVVRRRDGAIAYHLAGVVDDAAAGVSRVVRGRDLAVTTATQIALQRLLSLETPVHRHHLLLLEERGGKLAKLHGAVGGAELRRHFSPDALCGVLAHAAGLVDGPEPIPPRSLLPGFDWNRVREHDCALRWTGRSLVTIDGAPDAAR